MKKKELSEIILTLKKISDQNRKLYELGVDLINFSEDYYIMIEIMLKNIYTKESLGWFDWYCYENDFGRGNLTATDGTNPICEDINGLFKLLKHKNYEKEN